MLLPLLSPHALIKVGRNHDAREADNQMRERVIEWIVAELKRKLLAPSEQIDQHPARNAMPLSLSRALARDQGQTR
jgi:hypothetical protein